MTGKKRAIPSLHRDSLVAKVRGLYPDASSGNATSLYCRAVSTNTSKIELASRHHLLNLIMTRNISNHYRDLAYAPSFPITFYIDNYISATLTDCSASQFFNLIAINRTRANGFSINIS